MVLEQVFFRIDLQPIRMVLKKVKGLRDTKQAMMLRDAMDEVLRPTVAAVAIRTTREVVAVPTRPTGRHTTGRG